MTLSTVSNQIALYLGKNLASDQGKMEIYAYGMEILLGAAIKLLIVLALAWIIDVLNTTLIVLVTYAALRWFGGGAHMSTYFKCLILGTTIIVGMGRLSQFNMDMHLLTKLAMVTLFWAFYVCLKWAPGDTEKKPIREREIRLRQKGKMAIMIAVWGVVIIYLVQHCLNTYVLAMILGCISSVFFITPWGYRLFALLDKWTQRGGDYDESKTAEVGHEYSGRSSGVYRRNRS